MGSLTFGGAKAVELRIAVEAGPGKALAFFREMDRPESMTADHAQYEACMIGLDIAERAVRHLDCEPECSHPYRDRVWRDWSRFLLRWMNERGV